MLRVNITYSHYYQGHQAISIVEINPKKWLGVIEHTYQSQSHTLRRPRRFETMIPFEICFRAPYQYIKRNKDLLQLGSPSSFS